MPILKRSRNIAAKKLKLDDQTRFTKKKRKYGALDKPYLIAVADG
jgi:hypothetical protein